MSIRVFVLAMAAAVVTPGPGRGAALAGGGAGGPGAEGPGARSGAPVVTVVATEFHFTVPSTLPAGPTTLQLVNRGKQVHHLALIRLDGGKTLADLQAAMAKPGPVPAWAVSVGGPNAVDPGGSSRASLTLRPGRYVLACFVPDVDGKPHMMKGMLQEVTVTPAKAKEAPAAEPKPDLTVSLANYAFTTSAPLTAGEHVLRVRNTDTQWHEMVMFRLAPGKTAKDFLAWAESMKSPPPGAFEGGVSPLAPGLENEIPVNLHRGRYTLICFLEDAKDGKPHFAHGMVQEIQVQ